MIDLERLGDDQLARLEKELKAICFSDRSGSEAADPPSDASDRTR
jgi:hypothetical protein